jgi:multiple sugar transport system substrate-binding protein
MHNRVIKALLLTAFTSLCAVVVCSDAIMAKPVVISYWGVWDWNPALKQGELQIVERFNALNKGRIQVKAVPMGDVEQKVLTAVAGGAAPDLFKLDRFRVGSYAAKNVLTYLNPYLNKDKINPDIFYKSTWNETVYGGKVYAIPWGTDSRLLYYNKTLAKQLGLNPDAPPRTWEDLEAFSQKIDFLQNNRWSRVGFVPHHGNWYYLGWLWSAGGELLDKSARKVTWNNPDGLKAANFIVVSVKKYGGAQQVAGFADFTSGRLGAMVECPGLYVTLKSKTKKFEYGVAPPPRPAKLANEPLSWSGGFSMCIPRGSKHPKEAWEFIKYYTMNRDAQIQAGKLLSYIPCLKSAATDKRYLEDDPMMQAFVNVLPNSRFRPVIPAGGELWTIYVEQMATALTSGKKSPSQVLDETAAQAQKILDRAWSRVRNK